MFEKVEQEWLEGIVAFGVLGVVQASASVELTKGQWVTVLGPQQVTMGAGGGTVQYQGYTKGLGDDTYVEVQVDGVAVGRVTGDRAFLAVGGMAEGVHEVGMVVYSQMDEFPNPVVGDRAFVVTQLV